MRHHRFACGEDVILKTRAGPIFTITRLLPFEATSAPRYWVKAHNEDFSRVVLEDDIRVPPMTEPAAGVVDGRGRRGNRPSADWAAAEALFTRHVSR